MIFTRSLGDLCILIRVRLGGSGEGCGPASALRTFDPGVDESLPQASPFPPVNRLRKPRRQSPGLRSKLNDRVAARDDAALHAARSSRVIFFRVHPIRDPRREDSFLQVQRVSNTRRCQHGQRSRRSTTRCDYFNSNSCCPLGPTTAHVLPATCTGNSDPFDSHMWTDRQSTRGCSRSRSEGQRIFRRMRKRGRMGGAGSLGDMHASSVCFYMP